MKFLFSSLEWRRLCSRWKVSERCRPRLLGSGVESEVWTFGRKYVIKFTNSKTLWELSRSLMGKRGRGLVVPIVAVGRLKDSHNFAYYVLQRRVSTRVNQLDLSEIFAMISQLVDQVGELKAKRVINQLFQIKGFTSIPDLKSDNFDLVGDGIRIWDVGVLGR
jgi:hypothetical protein